LHIITGKEDRNLDGKQDEFLKQIQTSVANAGVNLTWEYDETNTIHARHIVIDEQWKISLDRGLDIFQNYEMNDAFGLSNRLQDYRGCKAFEVTYIKL
jgi:ATP-dependent Lon protease